MGGDEVELVARLRAEYIDWDLADSTAKDYWSEYSLLTEAADAIERLAARVTDLEADRARLNWMQSQSEKGWDWFDFDEWDPSEQNIRGVIDAARGAAFLDAARGAGRE